MKIKKHVLLPVVLAIYALALGVISIPRYRESGKWGELAIILSVSIVLSVLLYFTLKKKQNLRDKFKNPD